jgi:hypothetical protein
MWKLNAIFLVLTLLIESCSPDPVDDPIPSDIFNPVTLNLNLPAYSALYTNGGWLYYDDVGVRGVIIYRESAATYRVFERTCSYQPNNACATVDVHQSQLFLHDPCCSSTFDFSGNATGGPAWRPLLEYVSVLNGSDLTITDEVAN